MVPRNVCRTCGSELAPNAPAGLCVKCVFAEMLDPEPPAELDDAALSEAPIGPAKAVRPHRFGGYELLEEIARGGMGIVYRARQAQLKRIVALKVILAGEAAAPEFVRRFRSEAEAAASLDHPHIVPIYEIGEFAGQPFFSMKLIEGEPLGRRIPAYHNPEGYREAAVLIGKLANAVHYAHQRGILHRDLKPNNVLLDSKNEPHLTDFGLARSLEQNTSITLTNAVLGTPSYMAPEQARGETKQLTTAADVYGLGAILYELLTGQPPFSAGTTVETIRRVVDQEPRRPTALAPQLPRDLETICLKCLEKDPTRRYGSAEALAQDLERWLKGEPIQARPASTIERMVKWARRKPAVALLLSGLIVSLAVGFGVALWEALARQRALVQSRRALYAAQIGLVQQAWSEGHISRARGLLESARPVAGGEDLRGFEWRYFQRLCRDQSLYTVSEPQNPVQAVAASPDGKLLAVARASPYISLWEVASRRGVARLPGGNGNRCVAFSPDSKLVAAAGYDGVIRFWDVPSRRQLFELRGHTGPLEHISFSPDGARFASAGRPDGRVKLWDLAERREVASWCGPPSPRPALAFSPEGVFLAWSAGDNTIRLVELKTFQEVAALRGHSWWVVDLTFSPDGRWLASAGADGTAKLWDMAVRREVATCSSHKAWVTSVSFSPDSQLLATACIDGTIKLWNVQSRAEITTLKGHEMWVNNAVFLPDGHTLASGGDDGNLKLWEVLRQPKLEGVEVAQLPEMDLALIGASVVNHSAGPDLACADIGKIIFTEEGSRLLSVDNRSVIQLWDEPAQHLFSAFSMNHVVNFTAAPFADGRRIATAGRDGVVRIWTTESPQLAGELLGADGTPTTLAISGDGHRVAAGGATGKLWLWDTDSGQLTKTLRHGAGQLAALTFCPDGHALMAVLHLKGLGDSLCQFRLETGAVRTVPHENKITSIAMAPSGGVVATAAEDGIVRLWQPRLLELSGSLRGHGGIVTCLAFSPDNLTLATASNDGTVKLWSVNSRLELITLPGRIAPGTALAFSPDGIELAACGDDGSLRVWRAAPPATAP